jgi:tRNA U34 5-carboxymethylaminomethyl modifying GTPase MnmE/TrmE
MDLFWSFLIVLYGLVVLAALLAWWVYDDEIWIMVGLVAPVSIILCINAYINYALNDYKYFQDIAAINKTIVKHNDGIDKLQKKIGKFKKKIASQTGKNTKDVELSPEEIEELAKKKRKYQDEDSEEEVEENLEYDDEEVIEEGGDSDEEEYIDNSFKD